MADFKPIISHKKSNGLKSRDVKIEGTDDFNLGNEAISQIKPDAIPTTPERGKDPRFKATTTAKLSPYENLRLQTLKPFMAETEEADSNTINDIVGLLIDSYVEKKLTSRQTEAFGKIVEMQFDQLQYKLKK
jgi:hypothetical protein